MNRSEFDIQSRVLFGQIRWLIRLRWVAGAVVLIGTLLDALALHWYDRPWAMAAVGAAIILYNAVLFVLVRVPAVNLSPSRLPVLALIWAQILLDLACLTLLSLWTGGAGSPLLLFFVFHMVFASVLLSRLVAYAGAAAATAMLLLGLVLGGQLPKPLETRLLLLGWGVTLLFTVYLTNHIMLSLHRHRRRLTIQNRRIRALVERLRQQQQAMVQHEKIVALGQMAAGVAHEIANPLACMDGVLQLMQRNEKHVTAENVASLRQQAQRIKQTIQQLTNFAHPTEYKWQTTGINDLAEAGLELVRFDRRHQQIKIERRFSAEPCPVHVQPHAVQQALVNILLNALDAVAEVPNPRLVIATRRDGGDCRIDVADNGPGIPSENLHRIFEPFFTTKPVGKGTGLGLAISYSLIRNQGGRIDVRSEPGKGANVSIVLPYQPA